MTPEEIRKIIEAQHRVNAAAGLRPSSPMPTARMFVVEDPDKFKPGHVVVEDGSDRRMLIMRVTVGFAQCMWYGISFDLQTHETQPHALFDIVHTSMLTLHADQNWVARR